MVGGDEGDRSGRGDRPGIEVGRLRLGEVYTVYPFVVHGSGGGGKGYYSLISSKSTYSPSVLSKIFSRLLPPDEVACCDCEWVLEELAFPVELWLR